MNHVYPDFPAHGLNGGVSTRTYIATHAMMGLLADHKDHSDECADGEDCSQTVARIAVRHADCLITELNKAPGGAS